MWGLDLEAEDWDKVTNACFISDKGDVEHFEGPSSIEQAADFIDETGGTHLAHAAGIYDTLLVSQARERPWQDLTLSGGAVLCAHDRSVRLRDTFRWWLAGLAKVGKALEAADDRREKRGEARHAPKGHWLKKDVARNKMRDLTAEEKRKYCESDTWILMEGVMEALAYLEDRGARRAWTAGSSAVQLLQVIEPASWGVLKAHALDFKTALAASACVRGARVETWALGRVDNVYCYDVKSAYPAAYATEEIGIGAVHLGPDDHGRPGTVWRCRWYWRWRGDEDGVDPEWAIPPVLDQATGAGAGWCEAWCTEEEIDALEERVHVQRIEGWAPLAMVPVGQQFIRELYDEKELGSFFAKVFLNSLAGKFATCPVQECWKSGGKPTDYYGPEPQMVGDYWRYLKASVDKRGLCEPQVQPLAAAHILGRARIRLWKFIRALKAAGWEVYYCDTDSIHTNCPPGRMPFMLGNELGQLAFEGGPYTSFYVGPKSYCAVDPTTGVVEKGACKGMPWGSLKDGVRAKSVMWGHVYRQARDQVVGTDVRRQVFEEALEELNGAQVVKEGIATWRMGLRRKDGWQKYEMVRTLLPHERGKLFHRASGPTTWAYQTPSELLIGRGLDLSHDPWALPENPLDPLADMDREAAIDDLFPGA